jgi:hypothetical protein
MYVYRTLEIHAMLVYSFLDLILYVYYSVFTPGALDMQMLVCDWNILG